MYQSRSQFPRRRALLLLAALLLPLPTLAQDTTPATPDAAATDGTRPMRMNRMQGKHCPMMKGHGRMPQMLHMPRLPPGNDKLQLQMEAEILQKIGEIQGKYASQLP